MMRNGVDLEAMYEDEMERRAFRKKVGGTYKIESEHTRLMQERQDQIDDSKDYEEDDLS